MCNPKNSSYYYPYTFYQNSSCNPCCIYPSKFTRNNTFDQCVAEKIAPPLQSRLTKKSYFSENLKKSRKTECYKVRKSPTEENSLEDQNKKENSFEDQIKKGGEPKPLPKDARYIPELGSYKVRKSQTDENSLEDQIKRENSLGDHNIKENSFIDEIKKGGEPKPLPKDARYVPELGGYLMNENETKNWKGELPISDYPLNIDENPTIVTLDHEKSVDRVKRIDIKYLEPTKLPPGKLIIKREANHFAKEAPPVIIRVPATKRIPTPPTLIHRERPPTRPQTINETIRIPGEAIILPRRVITEQLAVETSKPQSEIYETWKPYETREIEVIYEPEQSFLDFNQNLTKSKKNVVNFSFNVNKFNEFISPLTKDLANEKVLNLDAINSVEKIDWKNVVHSEIIKCLLKAYMF